MLGIPVAGLVCVWLLATPLVANGLIGKLEQAYPPEDNCEDADILVVLAGGIKGRPDDPSEILRLRDDSIRRTLGAAAWLSKRPDVTALVVGGLGGRATEAEIMIRLLRTTGVSNSLVALTEPGNTREAAAAVARTVGAGQNGIALATSAYHMKRSLSALSDAGIDACPVATDHRRTEVGGFGSIVPNTGALQKTIISIHELAGLLLG
jgi:uncharacterized SAM-binding protein YcdF (DUF218 family)